MTAETSNARGEWVLVPREPSAGMLDSAENAMIESEWAYNAGEPAARSDAHGFPTMRIWQAVVGYRAMLAAAPPPPAAARGDVRGLVALAEQMERDAAGCRRDGYTDAAVVKEDCAQRIRQTLGISAIAEALAAEGVQPDQKPVLSEPDRIGLYQGPDDCPQLMVNDRPVAIFPAGSWAKVCDALDSITGSVQPDPKAEARGVVDVYTMQTIAEAAAALDKRGDRQMATRLMRLHTRLLAALTETRNG